MQIKKIFLGLRQSFFADRRLMRLSAINYNDEIDDPIQKLFLEKLKEYKQKSADGKMIDPTPEIENELKSELERINKQHGGDGKTDLTKFPEFKFPEITIDPIIEDEKPKQ